MRPKLKPEDQMTIDEFLAFTDSRPNEERWELIEGVPIMSPSPVEYHQHIIANLIEQLRNIKRRKKAAWIPVLGVGVRVPVSPNSLPQPDLYVKSGALTDLPVTEDALVLFEVLSRSNTKADQSWRRRVYASVPNCRHYVTVEHRSVAVVRYDRVDNWAEQRLVKLTDTLTLPALGRAVGIPIAEIYRGTPHCPAND